MSSDPCKLPCDNNMVLMIQMKSKLSFEIVSDFKDIKISKQLVPESPN